MLISHSYKFIFIHIGKTGGTSIEKVLCKYLDIDFEKTKKDENKKWIKHIWAVEARQKYEEYWDDYFKFAVVRNPADMLLSLYAMYTQYPEYCNIAEHPDLYHPWNQFDSFEHFLLSMDKKEHKPDDEWRLQLNHLGVHSTMNLWWSIQNLQSSYLTDSWKGKENGLGNILVDLVGRYENLEEDFHLFCEKVKLPRIPLVHHGATKHKPWQEVYTSKMKQIVYEHSKIDIERFGYGGFFK